MKSECVYVPSLGTGIFVVKTDNETLGKYVVSDEGRKYYLDNIEYFECTEKNKRCLEILYNKKFGVDNLITDNEMLAKLLDDDYGHVTCMASDGEFIIINKKSPNSCIFWDVYGVEYINKVLKPVSVEYSGVYEITNLGNRKIVF